MLQNCGILQIKEANDKYHKKESIKFIIHSIKPNLCDYSDAYIPMTGDILVTDGGAGQAAFKICAPFSDGKTNRNDVLVDLSNYIYIYIYYNPYV